MNDDIKWIDLKVKKNIKNLEILSLLYSLCQYSVAETKMIEGKKKDAKSIYIDKRIEKTKIWGNLFPSNGNTTRMKRIQ